MLKFILSSFLVMKIMAAEAVSVIQLGDSMEAGVFAGSGGIKSNEYIERQGSFFHKFLLWLVEDHESNWATGSESYSIVSRIESLGFVVDSYNAAISGATVSDVVQTELSAASAWKVKNQYNRVNLTIVAIGGNDSCTNDDSESMTSVNDFKDDFSKVIDYASDSISIVVVPLPDITELYKLKDKRCFLGMKCSKVWEITKNCTNITRAQNLPAIRQRIMEYNDIMKSEAQRVRAIYIDSVDMYKFDSKQVSRVDGFHPSKEGQEKISELVWEKLGVRK